MLIIPKLISTFDVISEKQTSFIFMENGTYQADFDIYTGEQRA